MRKDFSSGGFNVTNSIVFKNETINGFNIGVNAQKTDTTLATLASANKIGVDIVLTREGYKPVTMYSGYLLDLFNILYGQTTMYASALEARGTKYNFPVDFGGNLVLQGDDELEVKIYMDQNAFTSLVLANSSVFVETIQSYGIQSMMPVIDVKYVGVSDVRFSKALPGAISKIVLVQDLTAGYEASSKAKLSTLNLTAENFVFDASEDTVYAENKQMLADNPSAINNLVLYTGDLITDVNLSLKLSTGADADTKVISLGWANI
jgi:hypothetical protein